MVLWFMEISFETRENKKLTVYENIQRENLITCEQLYGPTLWPITVPFYRNLLLHINDNDAAGR